MKRTIKKAQPEPRRKMTRKTKEVAVAPKKVPPLPMIRGKPDPNRDECVLVPLTKAPSHPFFPTLNKLAVVPNTFYRFDKTQKQVMTFVTEMPDGNYVAWWSCRSCAGHLSQCSCPNGIVTPRSIEYIYDKSNAELNGEDWSVNHPNYGGSITKSIRGQIKATWEATGSGRKLEVITPPKSKSKRTMKRSGEVHTPTPDITKNLDMGKVDIAAAKGADDMTAELTRRLTGSSSKRTMKRTSKTTKRTMTRRTK